jgi:hypothetical protein
VPAPPKEETACQFQRGYRAVPISEADNDSTLRLCVVVRAAPDPVAGVFVLLRDTMEASLYLGCLVDVGGYVHQWLELWIQNNSNLQTAPEIYRQALSNHSLDERWKRRAALFSRLDRFSKIEIKWEDTHPPPIYFDLAVSKPVNPKDSASSAPWELCVDDQLLAKHGLPPYNTSLARYLYQRKASGPPFLPATTGCLENEATQERRQALGALIPLNVDGGLMMVRKFAPLTLEAYADLIGGQPWKGLQEGTKVFKLAGVYRTLQNADVVQQGGGHLFFSKPGRAGRLIETFYLKLDLLLQVFRLVCEFVRHEQLPFLNLSVDSFRVSLAETSETLPYLWTAKVMLSALGSAFALPFETSGVRYFVTPAVNAASIYHPTIPNTAVSATGTVRIRKILSQGDGTVVLEGTISTQERIAVSHSDLLWLRLTLSSGRVDFYANIAEGLARSEWRFRTMPRNLPDHVGLAIHSAQGFPLLNVPFETLPVQSSPSDLYALATIGVRILLVNDENSLQIALDGLHSLAQTLAADIKEDVEIPGRLREICATDSRWADSLGPHRLLNPQSLTVEESLAYMPAELWWDAVAFLVRCFPGIIPSAFCANLSDTPPMALHSVFESAIDALENLSLRTRSILFLDWKNSAEIHSTLNPASV